MVTRPNNNRARCRAAMLAASTLVTFLCCQQPSRLLSLHATLASFSMQSCQCLLMSLHSVDPDSFNSRQLRPFTRSLTAEAAKTLVQAFISCRLDYCNSLLYGVTDNVMRRVQSLQNAAARLITGARRRDHITPVLCQLHWLPVRQRVEFKLACLVRQALCGQMPIYLADDIHLVSEGNQRSLPSSSDNMCVVPTTYAQQLWRQKLWRCRPTNLEQSAARPTVTGLQVQTF